MTGSRPEAADAPLEELVRRSARGDTAAFARIVRLNHADMTRVAFVITGDLDLAAGAVRAAWPVAWDGLRGARMRDGLGPWLCALAATEAVLVARSGGVPGVVRSADPAELAGAAAVRRGDEELALTMDRLDPEDRALLALRHIAGRTVAELARTHRRSRPPVGVRLRRLAAAIDPAPASAPDPAMAERRVGQRLLAYADVPVSPVDSDAAARGARAGAAMERVRLVSVAVSAVVGAIVAGLPYLALLFQRH